MKRAWTLREEPGLNCELGPRVVLAEPPACVPFNVPCCPQHLLKCSFDVVKRWVNEAQEAASSDNIMVQVRCEWNCGI